MNKSSAAQISAFMNGTIKKGNILEMLSSDLVS